MIRPAPLRPRGLVARLESNLWPLSTPSAYSNRVWLILVPFVVLAQVLSDDAAHGGSPLAWAAAGAVGMAVVWVGLAAARAAARRWHAPRPLAAIGIFAILGILGSLATGMAAAAAGLIPALDFAYRFVSLGYGTVLLCIIATAVSRHDAHRALVEDLERKRQHLLTLERTMDAQLAVAEAELAGAVRASLAPAIRHLDHAISAVDGAGLDVVVADLERLAEHEVRPLSHRLASAEAAPAVLDTSAGIIEPVHVPLARRIPMAASFQPLLITVGIAAVAAGTAVRDLQGTDALRYLLALTALGGLLSLAGRAAVGRRTARALPTLVAATLGYALVGALALPLLRSLGVATPRSLELATAATAALAGLMIAAVPLVEGRRTGTEAERDEVVARLAASVGRIRRRQALVRRRLAAVLHGSVQGTLHAAALRLSERPDVDAELVDRIRQEIAAAFARLADEPPETGTLSTQATVDALALVWTGRRRVTTDMAADVLAAVARDRDADVAVAEVVQEAVNNAVRHGDAHRITIQLRLVHHGTSGSGRAVAVQVWNDGAPWREGGPAGLGTSLLNDLCASWTHESDDRGTTLTALVALA